MLPIGRKAAQLQPLALLNGDLGPASGGDIRSPAVVEANEP